LTAYTIVATDVDVPSDNDYVTHLRLPREVERDLTKYRAQVEKKMGYKPTIADAIRVLLKKALEQELK
jgi:hypothetical protein